MDHLKALNRQNLNTRTSLSFTRETAAARGCQTWSIPCMSMWQVWTPGNGSGASTPFGFFLVPVFLPLLTVAKCTSHDNFLFCRLHLTPSNETRVENFTLKELLSTGYDSCSKGTEMCVGNARLANWNAHTRSLNCQGPKTLQK